MLNSLSSSSTDKEGTLRLTRLWLSLCSWIGIVILFALTATVARPESWTMSLLHACSFWLLWLIFFPVIISLSLRFPLARPKIFLQATLHVGVCALVVVVSQVLYRTVLPLPSHPADWPSPVAVSSRVMPARMRAMPDILVYLVTMSACAAFAHFRESQERERRAIELEARLTQAKLQALRMQINPHFLFNTLNAISTLVHTNPHMADEMIVDLGELFRFSLESSSEQEISLSRELELLQRYLAIEQRRFGPRLQVEQNLDPEIFEALVPTLILQPLVENAIRHGIEPQNSAGIIVIDGGRDGNHLKLRVSDNGKKPLPTPGTASHGNGIGLANTRARLQQLYGDEQSFSAGEGELGGWIVEIKIPFSLFMTKPAA